MAGTGRRGGDEMKAVAGRSGGGTERGRCCPLTLQLLQLLDDPRPAGFYKSKLIDPAVGAGVRREHPPAVKTDPDAGLEQGPVRRRHLESRDARPLDPVGPAAAGNGRLAMSANGSPRCRVHLDHRRRHGSHGSAGEDHGAIRSAALRPCRRHNKADLRAVGHAADTTTRRAESAIGNVSLAVCHAPASYAL